MNEENKSNDMEMVTWQLPASLYRQLKNLFEEQHDENIGVEGGNSPDGAPMPATQKRRKLSICYKFEGAYYCEKMVNGVPKTYGPYLNCPPTCGK